MHTWQVFSIMTLILWGMWGVFSKLSANQGTSPLLIAMLSNAGGLAMVAFVESVARFSLNRPPLGMAYGFLAGAIGGLGSIFLFYALREGKISVVIPISACYPVLPILFGVMILKEGLSVAQGVGIGLALTGVLLMSL